MGRLTPEELNGKIKAREIDTVILAFPDPAGQLMGKRLTGDFFLENTEVGCCDYLMTIDIEEKPRRGFKISGWETGFGDLRMDPDFSTIHELPWQEKSALILCHLIDKNGKAVEEAPRRVLQRQVEKLAEGSLGAFTASELEFFLFDSPYDSVYAGGHQTLVPSSPYPVDYHILHTGFDDGLLRTICNQISEAGIPVESRKGETGKGQYEIGLKYAPALEMADRHLIYKLGAKTLAARQGKSLTFMAKYRTDESGSSCHIHISLTRTDSGKNAFIDQGGEPSDIFNHFLGGLIHLTPELFLFFAPTVNSYKRFVDESFAPVNLTWDYDNRTSGYRILGRGEGFRIENRFPGADANPYLAYAAMIAAGLHGIREKITPPPPVRGNSYGQSGSSPLPRSLGEAADRLDQSQVARDVFGNGVIDYYVHHARLEAREYAAQVGEWELKRYFERI